MQIYPTGLTDSQWSKIENYFVIRKRKHSLRQIINAMLYMAKSGNQWRMLPKEYPKWELVYYYFRKWTAVGLIEEILESLRNCCRKQAGRNESPGMGLTDSQSIKTSCITAEKGYDAGKKVSGRKRHIVTDTMGFILAIVIHSANIQDRVGVRLVLKKLRHKFPLMKKILADGGYSGTLVEWTLSVCGWTLEVVSKVVGISAFSVIPKRWVVDRTFGWVNFNRRLAKDYNVIRLLRKIDLSILIFKYINARLGYFPKAFFNTCLKRFCIE